MERARERYWCFDHFGTSPQVYGYEPGLGGAEPCEQRGIYRPETERVSHYFHAQPSGQFDLMIHIDETTAVEPLEAAAEWTGDLAETYPFGV